MSDYHYRKEISGGVTYHEGSFIDCHDAYIKAEGEFILAPTFTAAGFRCDTTAEVTAHSSATIVIDKLVAKKVTLRATASSTIVIRHLECEDLAVTISGSSTVRIEGGSIGRVTGSVEGSSTGVCRATIQQDDVEVSGSSTWDTGA